MTRIAIDPNVRVRGGLTYSGYEDVDGELPLDGQVEVYEPEGDLLGMGRVVDVDEKARLVYVEVEWSTLRPRLGPLSTNVRLLSGRGWVAILDANVHNEAVAPSVEARTIATRPGLERGSSSLEPQVGGERILTFG